MTDILVELRDTLAVADQKGARRLASLLRRTIAQIERLHRGRSSGGHNRWSSLSTEQRSAAARRASQARWGKPDGL